MTAIPKTKDNKAYSRPKKPADILNRFTIAFFDCTKNPIFGLGFN